MIPTFAWMHGPAYEPPYIHPATRRAYLKHRTWVKPVLLVLGILAIVCGSLIAVSGWEPPQL